MNYLQFARQRFIRQVVMGLGFMVILLGGWWYPILGYFIPLCMLLGMGLACFSGRKWCDWYCPRGSFSDSFIKPLSPNRDIPAVFQGTPLRVAVIIFLMAVMTAQLALRWPDALSIGHFFVIMLTVTTVIGLILSFFYQQRAWCYVCPIGSMANWVGRARQPLRLDATRCTGCGRCQAVCPMQLRPWQFKAGGSAVVHAGDCLKCGQCGMACPHQALTL